LINLPIKITDKNGDSEAFDSVEDAERSMECVDVRNNEYVVRDAHGKVLSLLVEIRKTRVLWGLMSASAEVVKISE
jgi:hypothetical protein